MLTLNSGYSSTSFICITAVQPFFFVLCSFTLLHGEVLGDELASFTSLLIDFFALCRSRPKRQPLWTYRTILNGMLSFRTICVRAEYWKAACLLAWMSSPFERSPWYRRGLFPVLQMHFWTARSQSMCAHPSSGRWGASSGHFPQTLSSLHTPLKRSDTGAKTGQKTSPSLSTAQRLQTPSILRFERKKKSLHTALLTPMFTVSLLSYFTNIKAMILLWWWLRWNSKLQNGERASCPSDIYVYIYVVCI